MSVEILIDGYNLLHIAGLAHGRFHPRRFESSRQTLIQRLQQSLTPEELSHTTIVFDAHLSEHVDRRPLNLGGIQVLFSPRGRQADDLIEEILLAARQPEQILVVSSDRRLQRAARHARAGSVDSDTFMVELETRRENALHRSLEDETRPDSGAKSSSSPDLNGWPPEFADIDVEAVIREEEQRGPRHAPVRASGPLPSASSPTARNASPIPASSQASSPHSPSQASGPATGPASAATSQGGSAGTPEKSDSSPRRNVPDEPAADKISAADPDELSFWEQRIAELQEEPNSQRPAPQDRHREAFVPRKKRPGRS